jgi:hypothetical protein
VGQKEGEMSQTEHLERHKLLHENLDELFADAINHANLRTYSTILQLIEWSFKQTELETIDHQEEE